MICRIHYRQSFARVIGYAIKRGKSPEVIASTLDARGTQAMIGEMQELAAKSSRCKQPVAHFVLSVREGERLTDGQWTEAAQRTAEAFGMQQMVCIRHSDTDCDHVHLIANRIKADGKAWATSNDRFKMRTLCQRLEEDFGITATASRSDRSRVNKDEIEKAARLFKEGKQATAVPVRMQLAEDIKASLAQSSSPQDFERRLKKRSISTRWRHDRDGKPVGVSFARGEASISGRNAGISCRAMMVYFEGGVYEQSRTFTATGPDSRVDRAAGRDFGPEAQSGSAQADRGHPGTDRTDSATGRDPTGHGGGDPRTPDILTESAQIGGQILTAALDRLIRDFDDGEDRDGKRRARAPEAHPSRALRRLIRTRPKPPQRPRR